MTLEQFLKSLSDLTWSCFWVIVIFFGDKHLKLRLDRNKITKESRQCH